MLLYTFYTGVVGLTLLVFCSQPVYFCLGDLAFLPVACFSCVFFCLLRVTVTETAIAAALPLCRTVRLAQPPIARTILNRATLKIFRTLGLAVTPLYRDVRTSIGATAV